MANDIDTGIEYIVASHERIPRALLTAVAVLLLVTGAGAGAFASAAATATGSTTSVLANRGG